MMGKNIAILTNSYSKNGGATKSIRECARALQQRGHGVLILSIKTSCEALPNNVSIVHSDSEIESKLKEFGAEVVIFFKAAKSLVEESIFTRYVRVEKTIEKRFKTIMVVCQQPSNAATILTPFEIKNSDHLVFIDKTADNDPLYSFIPKDRKSWTYLSIPDNGPNPLDKYLKSDYTLKNGEVVFGRGSSFNKCPRNVLEPFDKLNVSTRKKFIIVGVPKGSNWLSNKIKKREGNDVLTYPLVGFDEWMSLVSTFDIGLYYLPKNAHSSIDGTLGQMMRIGLPVIVGGAPAPKERIEHGVNGFIADTVPEMVKYAEMLACSQELRERIGRNARKSTIELNSKSWVDKLESIMKIVCEDKEFSVIHIPLGKILRIRTIYMLSLIKAWLVRPIRKVLKG